MISYQSRIIREELSKRRKMSQYTNSIPREKTFFDLVKEKATRYFILFLETSSIHGLNHLVASRRHYFEVLIWLVIVISSLIGAVYLSWTTWMRYQSSPIVISMDRDMFAWNTTFPGVTICTEQKFDQEKVDVIVRNSNVDNKEELEAFIKALTNATYRNFDLLPNYTGIPPESYLDILINVSSEFKPTLTIGASGISIVLMPTVTEMGLCVAINSQLAIYNSPEYIKANRKDVVESSNNTFFIHPLDGEVFATVYNLSDSYNVYIHSPLEVPDISTKYEHSAKSFYMKIYVTAMTVYTSAEAAKLSIQQRRCRYLHENNLRHNTIYTYNMCRMECRIRLSLKYCKCVPHFYRAIGSERTCNVEGLKCLSKRKHELYTLTTSDGKRINCGCLSNCDEVNYVIQSNMIQPWFLGTNLQWGLVTYPRMRYRRDLIFGFTDVLVSVGGMAGLFLGCSVLSFMEIVYFLTLRLVCYTHATIKS
ncbi:sodium channel protein Nach-like [Epargyreus clarus]|uniref:sodium channel protein Nach-like n=1 Tax=Epargyreus clarus TaxID=520877 RepID=UPI003C2C4093